MTVSCPSGTFEDFSNRLRHLSHQKGLQFSGRKDTPDGKVFIIVMRNEERMYIVSSGPGNTSLMAYSALGSAQTGFDEWAELASIVRNCAM
jgi:hypothetical protein